MYLRVETFSFVYYFLLFSMIFFSSRVAVHFSLCSFLSLLFFDFFSFVIIMHSFPVVIIFILFIFDRPSSVPQCVDQIRVTEFPLFYFLFIWLLPLFIASVRELVLHISYR